MKLIVEICNKHGVQVGHPHVTSANVERVLAEGYRLILSAPVRTYDAARKVMGTEAKPAQSSI
jgi:4-hydroxy-2-oxoheptanedioate aldolase